jgi:hypothetical protein
MDYSWKKILSGSFTVVFIAWACFAGGALAGIQIAVFETIGLMLIWNSDDLGSSAFPSFNMGSTPILLVTIGGWAVLLFPIIIIWRSCCR